MAKNLRLSLALGLDEPLAPMQINQPRGYKTTDTQYDLTSGLGEGK
ncbi:MAG: hypothetical protein LBJ02_04385 [Bifidobacteriaceae bacterium]|nr:hypothetical protein [Bifidobacteriaceae bacterium]